MKKILILVVVGFFAICLVACANQSLDGEYYLIKDLTNRRAVIIDGDSGEFEGEELTITNVNEEDNQLTYQGFFGEKTVNYTLSDNGVLEIEDEVYYKKGSKAYKEALKKYGHKEE